MYSIKVKDMHEFQCLLAGTWSNEGVWDLLSGAPYSYNVMPLPQKKKEGLYPGAHHGYILKNFRYTEVISFHSGENLADLPRDADIFATPAGAPNRAYEARQVPQALFYDQIVKFAEGPKAGEAVHIENGAWLYLPYYQVVEGPYPDPEEIGPAPFPDNTSDYAKQISVPHGNSILALGNYKGRFNGGPHFPDISGLPTDIDTTRYTTLLEDRKDYENPHVADTQDPLLPLRRAITDLNPKAYHHVSFSTQDKGNVINIPFEQRLARADDYEAGYWLLSTDGEHFDYLAYYQNIPLTLVIDNKAIQFPHVTSNVIKRQTPVY